MKLNQIYIYKTQLIMFNFIKASKAIIIFNLAGYLNQSFIKKIGKIKTLSIYIIKNIQSF